MPIPAKLVKSLKAWKAKADQTCGLLFPTAGCNLKLDFHQSRVGAAVSRETVSESANG
jgi:hypothetical protein